MLDSHISTYFNKDTCDLHIYVVHSAHVPVISCSILLLLFDYFVVVLLFFDFVNLLFDSFAFSLFIVQWKMFNSDPGLYSRYFDPVPVVHEVLVHHHLCKSNKHHTSDCTIFVLV
jgi:hypothetical protein